ncbi:hypothetical protein K438DRAFT_1962005 [Mycena galopus ATCC 62051]|nr:hypothetical protein K438DRAFT_1962005 [Mycena galopus ATCC 62051]
MSHRTPPGQPPDDVASAKWGWSHSQPHPSGATGWLPVAHRKSPHTLAAHYDEDVVPRDSDCGTSYSTALPSPLCTSSNTATYTPLDSSFSANTGPWQLNQSASTWSPNAIGNSATFPAFSARKAQPQYDVPLRESAWLVPVDTLANGVDEVSAAFLQLVESQEGGRLGGAVPLLRLLLSDGYFAQDELLDVVDWDRLRRLAETSVSRILRVTRLVPSAPTWGRPKLDELLTSNATTTPNDFSEIDHSDRSAELLPPADTTPDYSIHDYPLYDMSTIGSVVQPLTIPTNPWTKSFALLTPRPKTPLHPTAQSIEPGVHPSAGHQQSVSHTPHTRTILDAAGVAKRRCIDCGVEHTTQWRTHPEGLGSLCNACGQHQRKHRTPRSLQAIRRGRARANDKLLNTTDRYRRAQSLYLGDAEGS